MSKEEVRQAELDVIAWIKWELWRKQKQQKWLAEEMGIEASTLNNYMNGAVRISLPVLIRIIDVLQPSDEQLGELLKRGD